MSEFEFYVQIEHQITGEILGSGPLTSVSSWRYTARFDRAGSIAFTYDASDPIAQHVTNTRIARAYALLNGVWTEVGAGIIDDKQVLPQADGRVTVQASGLDLMRELSYRGVGQLEIGKPNGTTHAAAVAALEAYAPVTPGWTFTAAPDPGNDYIYARYDGESVLGALVYLAEKTGTHFLRGVDRELVFVGSFVTGTMTAHGGTAFVPRAAANRCYIKRISQRTDTHDLLTRIYPYGSGQGTARLTLASTNRTAPSGYTLNKEFNYIDNDNATLTYGLRDFPAFEFKEITPISNTAANKRAAANMLFDAALMELQRLSNINAHRTYELELEGCNELLLPLWTLNVAYKDEDESIDLNEGLNILETTWTMTPSGISTTRVVVSTQDRWPPSDASAGAERAAQGRVFQAHPQLSANSYWENGTIFIGSDQTNHIGEFPFVLGPEVATVDRVRFRFKVTEPISFTSVVAGTSTSSGASSASSSAGGSTHSHTVTISPHDHAIHDHAHETIVANGSTAVAITGQHVGDNIVLFYSGADVGDQVLLTIPDVGSTVVTSEDGGGSTPTSSNESSHTHNIPHTHNVTPTINTSHGVYRADAGHTYALEDLECRINGGSWVALDTADDVGDDYYEFDITADVQDPDTFTPLQENNLIEIRRAAGAGEFAIDSSTGDGTRVAVSTFPGESGVEVGDTVIITGSTYHNGVWTVDEVGNEWNFWINMSGDSNSSSNGTVTIDKSAMILCKLGVVTVVQAVALV